MTAPKPAKTAAQGFEPTEKERKILSFAFSRIPALKPAKKDPFTYGSPNRNEKKEV